MDPDRDPRFLATGRAATAAMTCGQTDLLTSTPPGCRTYQSVNQCDTLAGSRDRLRYLIHGSSGLRPSDLWLGSWHPQGVPPRRLAHCLIGRGDALSDMSDKSDGADGADERDGDDLSDGSRCLIGQVGRGGRIGRAVAMTYRTSRTSRTSRTDRTSAVAMPYRRGRRGGRARCHLLCSQKLGRNW